MTSTRIESILPDIEALAEARHDLDLLLRIRHLMRRMDIPCFIFSSFSVDEDGLSSNHHFLAECPPEWLQVYQHRHWYSNDPFLEHARNHVVPSTGSQIPLVSTAQREMRDLACRFGLRSCLVVPAHTRTHSMTGALQLANSLPPQAGGEQALRKWQTLLRPLSAILLQNRLIAHQQAMKTRLQLNERDLAMLRMVHAGHTAQEVAERFNLSVSSIYARYAQMNEKLGVSRIQEAARMAWRQDLLTPDPPPPVP